MTAKEIESKLKAIGSSEDARFAQKYFKTGPGEYGEGDRFLGIRAEPLKKMARDYPLDQTESLKLLKSAFNEARLVALLNLARHFTRGGERERTTIFKAYLAHTRFINNWNLVDSSAPEILGAHLYKRSRKPLYKLARSRSLWERRMSIVATHYFIRESDFADTLAISKLLLSDDQDLIHKASGWMLREVGKRDQGALEEFLAKNYQVMPRTMLRYAIERFSASRRKQYLKGVV